MATTILVPLMSMPMLMPIGARVVVENATNSVQLLEQLTSQNFASSTAAEGIGSVSAADYSVSLRPVGVGESIAASAVAFSQLMAITSVAELMAAFSFSGSISEQLVSDAVQANGMFSPMAFKQRLLADSILASSTALPSARVTVFSNDGVVLDGKFSFSSVMSAVLNDGAAVLVSISVGGEVITCWCTNAENLASSEYRGYNFNSLCAAGGKYYGAGPAGIYLLEGDTDAGVPIAASLLTGLMDFGSASVKHVPAGYISRMSDGAMNIAVVTVTEGRKQVNNYVVAAAVADAPRNARVPFGKGLRARYWQLELSNVGGADFMVDEVAMTPAISMRRI